MEKSQFTAQGGLLTLCREMMSEGRFHLYVPNYLNTCNPKVLKYKATYFEVHFFTTMSVVLILSSASCGYLH